MDNNTLAERLMAYARELDRKGSNLFRARAVRRAAEVVRGLARPVSELVAEGGRCALSALPGIGESLAHTIEGLVTTGELTTLHPQEGSEPDRELSSLPGIGRHTALSLRDRLGIKCLAELESAARAGRLAEVGIGPKRLRGLLDALSARKQGPTIETPEPTVEDILAVDEEYRKLAEVDDLPRVAPRDYNPEGAAWLPVFAVRRNGWNFKALFSNTALAHRLGMTTDWVVVYFANGTTKGQRTVVTETRGDLAGKRVVRGRENECRVALEAATPAA